MALRVSVLFASVWIGKHGLALLGRAFHCFAFFLYFFFISFAFTLCVSVAFFVLVDWCVYCCGRLCALSFLGICCDLVWSCCCFHVYISCEVVFLFCFHVLVVVHCCWRVFLCVFVLFESLAGMVMCVVLACVFAVV